MSTETTNNHTSAVILVVDDQKTIRSMIRQALEQEGYEVVEAENGLEAVQSTMTHNPDVIIMDIVMPVLDGLKAIQRIHRIPEHAQTPIMVSTSLKDSQSMAKAFSAGAADFVSKPIDWHELKHRVLRLVQLRRMQNTLQRQAYYDALTGLPNRFLFRDRLEVALVQSEAEKSESSVLFLNIRDFALFNDAYGYSQGDVLLQLIAERIGSCLKPGQTLARMEGNSFAVSVPRTGIEGAARLTEAILANLGEPVFLGSTQVSLNCNIGISLYPHDGDDCQALINCAQIAMTRASREAKNTYLLYNEDMSRQTLQRLQMEHALKYAVKNNELELYYQPQVCLKSGTTRGVEALLRWFHPDLGMVSPVTFIPIAEETRLIMPIGNWVIDAACQQAMRWVKKGTPVCVSVNISPHQFVQPDIYESIAAAIARAELPPYLLKVEITESTAMQDIGHAVETLQKLKKLGVKVSIDDFGTGYSSFYHLLRLPLDELKIDRSIISLITEHENSATITAMVIGLALRLGVEVVAEGVETADHVEKLQEFGCKVGQGFYYSKPVPASMVKWKFEMEGRERL